MMQMNNWIRVLIGWV